MVIDFLMAEGNFFFVGASGLLIVLGLLEVIGLLVGGSVSSFLDSDGPDTDGGADIAFSGILGWLYLGRIPLVMWLLIFLWAFSSVGFAGQLVAYGLVGLLLPWYLSVPAALMACLPLVRLVGGLVLKVLPQNESSVVSEESFVGSAGQMVFGTAAYGFAAEAKLWDIHGRRHYIMVEPFKGEPPLPAGSSIIVLAKKSGSVFFAKETEEEVGA